MNRRIAASFIGIVLSVAVVDAQAPASDVRAAIVGGWTLNRDLSRADRGAMPGPQASGRRGRPGGLPSGRGRGEGRRERGGAPMQFVYDPDAR